MKHTYAWVAALVALPALAGCLGDASDDSPLDDANDMPALAPFVNPISVGHDHDTLEGHEHANNMHLIATEPVTPDGPPGYMAEIDIAGDHAFVAIMNVGFAIIDVSDPANPVTVSIVEVETPAPPVVGHYTADLKADAEGNWVFLAMELSTTPGVLIYDVRDKANPQLAGFWPAPGTLLGCHMVEYASINEEEYLFCAPLDNAVYVGRILPATPSGQREIVTVARWVPNHPKFVEQQVAALQNDPVGYPFKHVSGHQDMTFQEDPLTGTPMLTVSFWNLGTRFVDVSIPEVPIEVGSWDGEDGDMYTGLIHTSMMMAQGDRRIAFSAPEVARPPALFVLDITDYDNPTVLAQWVALDDFEGEDTTFSLHNFQLVGDRLYMAMYHGGVWVLDISNPEVPTPVGSHPVNGDRPDGADYRPGVWDVVVHRGYTITADGNAGLTVLHYAEDPIGSEEHSGFA